MSKPTEAVLLGAGSRGYAALGAYARQHPDQLRIVAVAEPHPERRARAAAAFELPADRVFADWPELLDRPQLAAGLINATMDQVHVPSTLAALERGYHVLCEKPMATEPHDCVRLVRAAERAQRHLQICHVMRYAPFWRAIRRVLDDGRLGTLHQLQHTENVAFWHQAHSFVRGNWGNRARSAPMILAKCCHDLDMLVWLIGTPCRRVASVGGLAHFRREAAPAGATERCLDCPVEPDCPYSAPRQYLGDHLGWPTDVIAVDLSLEARREALRTGPYGRCVYHCDNDVVDHQSASLEFVGGVTVSFTMYGLSHDNVRTLRYAGSRGVLRGHEGTGELTLHRFHPRAEESLPVDSTAGGHGGGDAALMADFVATLRNPGREVLTTARASLESHLIAFAAEESRLSGTVVDMDEYRSRIEADVAAAGG